MQTLALLLCLSLVMPAAGAPSWEELALTRLASWLGSSGMPGAQLSVGGPGVALPTDGSVGVLARDLPRNQLVKALTGLAGGFGGPDPVVRLEFRSDPQNDANALLRLQLRQRRAGDQRATVTAAVQLLMKAFKVPGEIRKSGCLGAQYTANGETADSLWFDGLDLQLEGTQQASLRLLLPPGLTEAPACAKALASLGTRCEGLELQAYPAPTEGLRAGRAGLAVVLTDRCAGKAPKATRGHKKK